ncbi:alpha-adducin isoform X6 [Mixophyes fleayi]|uniref:alpha-adducin isoform X6 n=1 Tax=Mixophyes fleayi TaxID=3061075 RepID=UPI003F4DBE07
MNGDADAGVVTSPPPTNAPHKEKYFDRVDENNPEYLRERNMAPDLRQDFNMMEQKKRVSMILQSPAFCDELETMIQDQLKKGKNPTGLLALQQIADFMTTSVPSVYPSAPQGGMAALNLSLGMVTPVNDLRGSDSIAYEKGEKLLRCKLAAFYRLADLFGWSQLIYNHITVRVSSEQEHFLIVPFGLLYSEVTASSLVKINLQGDLIDRGSTNLGVNKAGFTLHSAIYAARPDVKCIVHIHTAAGAAVSAMKCGLLPLSPEALCLGEVTYHDYHGILVDEEEKILIQKNLGPRSRVLILRNHGLVTMGETVEEAFYYIHQLVSACEIQVRTLASAGGPDNLVLLDPGKYKKSRSPESPSGEAVTHPKWLIGEQEFEALMRMLDNLGYRTGYPYRCPALRDKAKKYSDVEIPASVTGYSFGSDGDSGSCSPLRHSFQKQQREKTKWLNSGRADDAPDEGQNGGSPKSKTKVWTNITHDHVKPLLQSLSSGVCVPSCITNCLWTKEDGLRTATSAVPNLFVPLNTDPKEVQEMRNKIREQNLQDIKTAGPQSQVLCGGMVDRSMAQRLSVYKDAPLSDCAETIDGFDLSEQAFSPAKTYSVRKGELITASKAIIEKEYQPRVIISTAGPNPFNKLTDRELDEYRKEVERKQKDAEDQPEELAEQKDTIPDHSLARTPPSTPNRQEESQQEQTYKDDSDAATFKQTLPDLTPDEPSEALCFPASAKPNEEQPASGDEDLPKAHTETSHEEIKGLEPQNVESLPATPVAQDAVQADTTAADSAQQQADAAQAEVAPADAAQADAGSDESPGKSPSKKKKKFRTPSFLKKNKKKSES